MESVEFGIFQANRDVPPKFSDFRRSAAEDDGAEARRPTVLVVDDQHLIADSLVDILNGSGFDATAAYDGAEALQVAEQIKPDYLLSDVVMPKMNGVDLAIEVEQRLPDTRILLLSGQVGVLEFLNEGRRRGYEFEIIAKPIHPEKLIQEMKKL